MLKPQRTSPGSLNHLSNVDNSDATWGYDCKIHYKLLDQFATTLPNNIEVNENWTGNVVADYQGMNWRRGSPNGTTVNPNDFYDDIQGETSDKTPTPQNPQSPLGTTKVYHWPSEINAGSTTIGSGVEVKSYTNQKYRDHARHE